MIHAFASGYVGTMNGRKMTRREVALHSLQAEFMRDADPDEWVELPGGAEVGKRIPDFESDWCSMTGCWFAAPLEDADK